MAEPKTKLTQASVERFIDQQDDESIRDDCRTLVKLLKDVTGEEAKMWGPAIIGAGSYRLTYSNGKTADWPVAAFSPRKQNLTIYVTRDFDAYESLIDKLGKCKTSKACIYVKKLSDIHLPTLKLLLKKSVEATKKKYPTTSAR